MSYPLKKLASRQMAGRERPFAVVGPKLEYPALEIPPPPTCTYAHTFSLSRAERWETDTLNKYKNNKHVLTSFRAVNEIPASDDADAETFLMRLELHAKVTISSAVRQLSICQQLDFSLCHMVFVSEMKAMSFFPAKNLSSGRREKLAFERELCSWDTRRKIPHPSNFGTCCIYSTLLVLPFPLSLFEACRLYKSLLRLPP